MSSKEPLNSEAKHSGDDWVKFSRIGPRLMKLENRSFGMNARLLDLLGQESSSTVSAGQDFKFTEQLKIASMKILRRK
jgi:hypothetical protein